MEVFYISILGLAVGSFLNVLIDRLPQEKSIFGRSQCDFCKKKLKTLDLIPVFSFLFLAGKCRYCKHNLPWQYPIVEFLTAISFVWIWLNFATPLILLKIGYLGMFSSLIVIFFTDLKYHVITDQILIAMAIFIAGIVYFSGGNSSLNWLLRFRDGLLVALPILLIYLVSKGKAMGFADVKFAFLIGFFLNIIYGFFAIYLAFIIGAFFGLILVFLGKKKMKDAIAFGPFLALGFTIMIIWGERISELTQGFFF